MNYWGYGAGMTGGGSLLPFLTWLVVFIDLILLGVWLWKMVSKK